MAEIVRTRFAPSPTGFLHVGGVRTALFAWLVARQGHGQFILRIEDTDKKREVAGAEEHLIKSLKLLGLDYDEGPDIGGPHGSYRQSERLDSYRNWAQKLIESGRAYTDPFTAKEVQAFRDDAIQSKRPFLYRNHRPDSPPAWDGTQPLRFKSEPQSYTWHDEVMGDVSTGPEVIDDFILIKSDGYPTYNFAHIIDDLEMKISHVIRGQEFLASVPNYLNLYEALGIERPVLATMPHILGPGGQKKLSKRDGARDVLEYVSEGFMPEALISFIATLGWNDGTEQEIFSREELLTKFSLGRVQKSGAHFDEQRLLWINGHYIRELPLDNLAELAEPFWPANNASPGLQKRILEVTRERLKKLSELPQLTNFFFSPLEDYKKLAHEVGELFRVYKKSDTDPRPGDWLESIIHLVRSADINDPGAYEEPLKTLVDKTSGQPMTLYGSIRVALTGTPSTPPVWEILYVLDKEESVRRLKKVISELKEQA